MKKHFTSLFLIIIGIVPITQALVVSIPDSSFKAYLVSNTSINTNNDSEIQTSEADLYTGRIICNGKGITDLTGIEAFENISSLNCAGNALTTLTLGNKPKLTELTCQYNSISAISIAQHGSLNSLDVRHNKLKSVDILIGHQSSKLTNMDLSYNEIESLNLSNCIDLTAIQCFDNKIKSLDLTNLPNLIRLQCSSNDITSLDFSGNSNVEIFEANDCKQLTQINAANGNNRNFVEIILPPLDGTILFSAINNPKLTCIRVDDVTYSKTNWNNGNKDATAEYSSNCGSFASISTRQPKELYAYPNPAHSTITLELPSVNKVSVLSLQGTTLIEEFSSKIIHIESLAPGMYIIQASDGEQQYTSRFIKN